MNDSRRDGPLAGRRAAMAQASSSDIAEVRELLRSVSDKTRWTEERLLAALGCPLSSEDIDRGQINQQQMDACRPFIESVAAAVNRLSDPVSSRFLVELEADLFGRLGWELGLVEKALRRVDDQDRDVIDLVGAGHYARAQSVAFEQVRAIPRG